MKRNKLNAWRSFTRLGIVFCAASLSALSGCQKNGDKLLSIKQGKAEASLKGDVKQKKNFVQVNLVANTAAYNAARIDPLLLNALGAGI